MKSETEWIARKAPDSGRRGTLVEALRHLESWRMENPDRCPVILEVGTSRNLSEAAMRSDGWATRVFAWYVSRVRGTLYTVDRSPSAIEASKQICGAALCESVRFRCADALELVGALEVADLVYLDGPADAEWHRDLFIRLGYWPKLVLVDDVGLASGDKGAVLIPWLVGGGLYRLVFVRERQALLQACDLIPRDLSNGEEEE